MTDERRQDMAGIATSVAVMQKTMNDLADSQKDMSVAITELVRSVTTFEVNRANQDDRHLRMEADLRILEHGFNDIVTKVSNIELKQKLAAGILKPIMATFITTAVAVGLGAWQMLGS